MSRLLAVVPGAGKGGTEEAEARGVFAKAGVEAERLHLRPPLPGQEYLELYKSLDVVLDTFPYNGHTTTLDALWMGVPTVTLVGESHLTREGFAILRQVGLEELVAQTQDQYVEIAVRLVSDPSTLGRLRLGLRQRVAASPLRDEEGLARRLEAAYRAIWTAWCESR